MKKFCFAILLLLPVLNIIGQDCTVKITYAVNKTNPPGYTFKSDYAGGEAKYYWYFGDNTQSDAPSPTHAFKISGTYEINLKILDSNGKVCYGKLTDKFEGAETTNTGPVIYTGKGRIKNPGIDGCGLMIYLENGTVLQPVEMIPNFLLKEGQYVELAYEIIATPTVCMSGKSAKIHKIAEIPGTSVCKAYFTATNHLTTDQVLTKKVVFSNKSTGEIRECHWNFGDGTTSNELSPSHEYNEFGEYKVCLVIATTAGCKSDYCATVVVKNNSTTSECNFDLIAKQKQEVPNVFVFYTVSNYDIKSWLWNFGDGKISDSKEVAHTYEKAGTYEVKGTITTVNGCTVSKTVKISVTLPTGTDCKAYFTATNHLTTDQVLTKKVVFSNKSTGEIRECHWNFGDGTTGNELSPSHEYKEFGEYKVCLIIATTTGCKSDYCAMVKVASGQTATQTTACGFDIIAKPKDVSNAFIFYVVTKSEIKTIRWSMGDGKIIENSREFSYTYEKTGVYEVNSTLTTADNCTATRSIRITVSPPPLPACKGAINLTLYDPTGGICNGKAKVALLDETGNPVQNVKYHWSNGGTGTEAGNLCSDKPYTVTAMIENTCQKSTSFTFLSKPVWRLTTTDGKFGFEVIDPKPDLSYKWDFGDGNSATGFLVNYSYPKDGTYNVKLTVTGEGSSANFSQEISVLKSITSVKEILENQFRLYPNPAKDMIRIDFGVQRSGKLLIEAIDIRGQKVFNQQLEVSGRHLVDLDVNQIPPGLYVLKITNNDQILQTRKFIKKD